MAFYCNSSNVHLLNSLVSLSTKQFRIKHSLKHFTSRVLPIKYAKCFKECLKLGCASIIVTATTIFQGSPHLFRLIHFHIHFLFMHSFGLLTRTDPLQMTSKSTRQILYKIVKNKEFTLPKKDLSKIH